MSTPNAFAWVKKVEAEHGQPIDQILQQAADAAPVTGYTMADLAREWGIKRNALYYYCTQKLGIRFPRGVSAKQKEKAAISGRSTGRSKCRHWITVNGELRTLRSECTRIGRDYSTVRLLMEKHGVSAEIAIQMPSVPRVERYRRAAA